MMYLRRYAYDISDIPWYPPDQVTETTCTMFHVWYLILDTYVLILFNVIYVLIHTVDPLWYKLHCSSKENILNEDLTQ